MLTFPVEGRHLLAEGFRGVVDPLGLRLAVAGIFLYEEPPSEGLGHAFGVEHHLPPVVAPTESGGDADHLCVFFLERLQLTIGLADSRFPSVEGAFGRPALRLEVGQQLLAQVHLFFEHRPFLCAAVLVFPGGIEERLGGGDPFRDGGPLRLEAFPLAGLGPRASP